MPTCPTFTVAAFRGKVRETDPSVFRKK